MFVSTDKGDPFPFFAISEDHEALREAVRNVARDKIAPYAAEDMWQHLGYQPCVALVQLRKADRTRGEWSSPGNQRGSAVTIRAITASASDTWPSASRLNARRRSASTASRVRRDRSVLRNSVCRERM